MLEFEIAGRDFVLLCSIDRRIFPHGAGGHYKNGAMRPTWAATAVAACSYHFL